MPGIREKEYEGKEGKVVALDILNKKYTFVTDDEEYIEVIVDEKSK